MLSNFFSRRRLAFKPEEDDESEDELDRLVSGGFHSVSPHMLFPTWWKRLSILICV